MTIYKVKRKGRRYPKVFFSYEEARQFVRKQMRKWLRTEADPLDRVGCVTPDGTQPSLMGMAGFRIERV